MVHEFSTRWFGLPRNHTPILQDAVAWADGAIQSSKRYDYIIHDVFTGGAEPLSLFTDHFLSNLRSLLTPHGVIALNYAGDLTMIPTKQVLNTINIVFHGKCRMYRDTPFTGDSDSTFVNIVIFCRHPDSSGDAEALTFRKPVEADYLGSESRRHYMLPKEELALAFPNAADMEKETELLLTRDNMHSFQASQVDSARKHWFIMRKVVPAFVWENW